MTCTKQSYFAKLKIARVVKGMGVSKTRMTRGQRISFNKTVVLRNSQFFLKISKLLVILLIYAPNAKFFYFDNINDFSDKKQDGVRKLF